MGQGIFLGVFSFRDWGLVDQRSFWEWGDWSFHLAFSLDFHIGVSKQGSVLPQPHAAFCEAPSSMWVRIFSEKTVLSASPEWLPAVLELLLLGRFCWASWGSLSSYKLF